MQSLIILALSTLTTALLYHIFGTGGLLVILSNFLRIGMDFLTFFKTHDHTRLSYILDDLLQIALLPGFFVAQIVIRISRGRPTEWPRLSSNNHFYDYCHYIRLFNSDFDLKTFKTQIVVSPWM
ncbi:hypothetical protein BDY21DRAFT_364776 [Lineolata rhizophorae]|uniref:Uncharacterized protein n=1 Tax=Lineolata rhizophorae TaxID=578093 RepID=A0A6A6NXN5_9PEZI|nr:hypothetical protein BDY21DRAFT_364776 [Lineolata rhizophorae]